MAYLPDIDCRSLLRDDVPADMPTSPSVSYCFDVKSYLRRPGLPIFVANPG